MLWPGDSKLGVLAFPFEVNDADDTVVEFLRFLKEKLELRRDQTVSFVPKIIVMMIVAVALLSWISVRMADFAVEMFTGI